MNKFFLIASIPLLIVCSDPAFGQENDWQVVAESNSGSSYSMRDADIRNNTDQLPEVWVQEDASRNKTVEWRSAKDLYKFDCGKRRYLSLYTILYKADGSVLKSWEGSSYEWKYIAPDTVIEGIAKAACPIGSF